LSQGERSRTSDDHKWNQHRSSTIGSRSYLEENALDYVHPWRKCRGDVERTRGKTVDESRCNDPAQDLHEEGARQLNAEMVCQEKKKEKSKQWGGTRNKRTWETVKIAARNGVMFFVRQRAKETAGFLREERSTTRSWASTQTEERKCRTGEREPRRRTNEEPSRDPEEDPDVDEQAKAKSEGDVHKLGRINLVGDRAYMQNRPDETQRKPSTPCRLSWLCEGGKGGKRGKRGKRGKEEAKRTNATSVCVRLSGLSSSVGDVRPAKGEEEEGGRADELGDAGDKVVLSRAA
jgi:hypothetical protein